MSCHYLQRVLWHVRTEGLSIIQPAHVTVQMAMMGLPVEVSALHARGVETYIFLYKCEYME